MANRKRGPGGWLLTLVGILLLSVFDENLADLWEAIGLNRLWTHTGMIGTALLWVFNILTSPVATHFYVFVAGILVAIVTRAMMEDSGDVVGTGLQKPDMTISELVDYLTTDTVWRHKRGFISDRMVEHELLDAFSSGKLVAFARKLDQYGSTSPLYRMNHGDFEHLRIDLNAIRAGSGDAIPVKPGYFADTSYHDWRVFSHQAEQIWPRWVAPKPSTPKRGLRFGLKKPVA